MLQQIAAGFGKFIQRQTRTCDTGEDRQHAGACGGFQNQVVTAKPRRLRNNGRERKRGRELLQAHAVFGTPRVRRRQTGEMFNHVEEGVRRGRLALHQRAVARKHQDLGHLSGLIGVFPDPGATGVICAESLFHGGTKGGSVDRPARFEQREEGFRSLHQLLGEACSRGQGRGFGLGCKLDGMGVSVHRQSPGLWVGPEPRAHSLTREGSPLPPCLSLFNGSAELRLGRGKLSPESGDDAVGAVAETLASLKDYLRA